MENTANVKANTQKETKKETKWVTTRDGIRMTEEEYLDMRKREMDYWNY